MSSKQHRPVYRGTERGFVITVDVGTTFSGTSWALLEPMQVPEIWDVAGFEGQEFQAGSTKVPTVIYYDNLGEVRAIGSQTLDPEISFEAQEEGWIKVEWFKLLLRPNQRGDELEGAPETFLPPGKTVVDVLGDYLRYMAGLARNHFFEKMIGAKAIWEEVESKVQYVLSHPNGWNTFQHSSMREAAIQGSLISNSDDEKSRIHFVSEGEASLHWCMSIGIASKAFKSGSNIMVVDAGGGTIDISSFNVTATAPLQLKELSAPDCHVAGSVFVTGAFRVFVEEKLGAGSIYGDPDTIERLVDDFDKKAKCTFRRRDRKTAVAFGSSRDIEKEFDIMSGRLVVDGHDMAKFFERSCVAAVGAIKKHASSDGRTTVFLVGGFSGSPWLFSELQRRVANLNVDLIRAENSTAKAAANGAASFYLDHFVNARVARHTYGVPCARVYVEADPARFKRRRNIYEDPASGQKVVSGGFTAHIRKGTVVYEREVTRVPLAHNTDVFCDTAVNVQFMCYKGDKNNLQWIDEDEDDLFQTLCYVHATIPEECLTAQTKLTPDGRTTYWRALAIVVVSFGTTEFKCYIEWTDEEGVLQRGSATPVWNEG